MKIEQRAPREEIFGHLKALLCEEATIIAIQVADHHIAGEKDAALKLLKEYDETLGGMGIYASQGRKLPGIYRALTYVELPLQRGDAVDYSRSMIHASCGYLEELIKKMSRLGLWEKLKDSGAEGLPLGGLIEKLKGKVPETLLAELRWLNSRVYVFAKHTFNMQRVGDAEPDHYFALEEAIAVYLIARKLVVRQISILG